MEIIQDEFLALLSYDEAKQIKKVNGNRDIRDNHIHNLINNHNLVKDGVWNQLEPIIVDADTNELHNGQHRTGGYFYAYEHGLIPKESKLYVLFKHYGEQTEKEKIITIKDENSVKSWTYKDGINADVQLNDPNYIQLRNWCLSHPLCHDEKAIQYRNAAAMMLGQRFDFTKNYFTFDEKKAEYASKIHDEMVVILKDLKMSRGDACVESMATAWYKYSSYYDFAIWRKYIKQAKEEKKMLYGHQKTKGKSIWDQFFKAVYANIKMSE